MNEDLVLAITMLIILAVVVLFIQISQQIKVKRIQKMKIQRRFGEIPDMEEILPIERISVYHKHQGREDVDQVFQRIDQCDSAAGEAVLYNMLHCTDNGQAQWKELLKYYEEQAETRKKAEAILISLGKREGLYYLPEYVDTLQASHDCDAGKFAEQKRSECDAAVDDDSKSPVYQKISGPGPC